MIVKYNVSTNFRIGNSTGCRVVVILLQCIFKLYQFGLKEYCAGLIHLVD